MGRNAINLKGKRFGLLTVLRRVKGSKKRKHARWLCLCDCGNKTTVEGRHLRKGETKSCGCLVSAKKKFSKKERVALKSIANNYGVLDEIHIGCFDPYQNLANAIVAMAVCDYRYALNNDDSELKEDVEDFFDSEWYEFLTNANKGALLDALHKEYQKSIEEPLIDAADISFEVSSDASFKVC